MEAIHHGIILRTRPLTESSLIVELLSETEGRISLVAKGGRRAKSPFIGKLDLFHEIRFDYLRSKRSDLHTLREMVLTKTYSNFRTDLQRLYAGAYCVNLVEKSTERDTPIPEVYHLFRAGVASIHDSGASPKILLTFELKMLSSLGFEPELEQSFLQPGTKKMAEHMLRRDWSELPGIQLSSSQEQELSTFLAREIAKSLESVPKGRSEALQLK